MAVVRKFTLLFDVTKTANELLCRAMRVESGLPMNRRIYSVRNTLKSEIRDMATLRNAEFVFKMCRLRVQNLYMCTKNSLQQ